MRRGKNVIISEILNICIDGASKSRIVHQVNLNFKNINPYLDLLTKNNLIKVRLGNEMLYETTDRGMILLESYNRIRNEISEL